MILELIMVTASKKLLEIRWEHVEETGGNLKELPMAKAGIN